LLCSIFLSGRPWWWGEEGGLRRAVWFGKRREFLCPGACARHQAVVDAACSFCRSSSGMSWWRGKKGWIWWRVYSSLFKRSLYSSGGPLATPIHLAGRGSEEVEKGVSEVTEGGGGLGSAAQACAVDSSARGLPRAGHLRLSPLARGRCGESDGGLSSVFGAGGVFFAALCARPQWNWEACFLSITSAATDGRPTSKAPPWPIFKPVKGSGICLISLVQK
jgi:hypothetical protein